MARPPFLIRVRIGEMEVELGGERDEVIMTLDDLESIVEKVSKAFESENLEQIPDLQSSKKSNDKAEIYPKIPRTTQCGEAVISLLGTEWGETPRTMGELREGMEANAIFFPKTTLSGVLVWLVKKGDLRRWKDKKRGYLYVINEKRDD